MHELPILKQFFGKSSVKILIPRFSSAIQNQMLCRLLLLLAMNYSKLYEILSKRQHAFLEITKTDSFGLVILSKTRRYNHYSMYDHDEVIICCMDG